MSTQDILEAHVNAALAGHDLSPFEPVTDRETGGYEARCRQCGKTVWVGENGVQYGLLGEWCEAARQHLSTKVSLHFVPIFLAHPSPSQDTSAHPLRMY